MPREVSENPYSRPIDTLSAFTHPDFNQQFRYMDDHEGVLLAQGVLDKFSASGYKTVIAMESGTSPLIQIMQKLGTTGSDAPDILQLKVPRDPNFNLLAWFQTYLSAEELSKPIQVEGTRMTRRQALATACGTAVLQELVAAHEPGIYHSIADSQLYDSETPHKFQGILAGTALWMVFNQPFLFFDEYINSGTVLRNFNGLARLFCDQPDFKLAAFCAFVDDAAKYDKIAFTLYDKRTELACYQNGAYPYENRIDIIGYYYFVSPDDFEKVPLEALYQEVAANAQGNPEAFYDRLMRSIRDSDITDTLKQSLSNEQVRAYVSPDDVARFAIKQLEQRTHGTTKYWDLLDQAFELYAPAWSPMPVQNHLDYWDGFAAISDQITHLTESLQTDYRTHRGALLGDLITRLLRTKKEWDVTIDHIIKETKQ